MVRQAHHPEPGRRVNLKYQYSMTKTFGLQRVSLDVPEVCACQRQPGQISNFGHWDLFDICDLGFVIWYLGILRHCINIGSFILFSNYPGLTYPIM